VPIIEAFAHTGFDIDRAFNHIYLKQEGVFGIMCRVLVTYVILFIFFGAFLKGLRRQPFLFGPAHGSGG
jgi:TRAP-type uncharacterized transport system fused permease subunit